ncbi:MAG: hypothetical protein AB1486_19420 [Planctomycetota bacterium]
MAYLATGLLSSGERLPPHVYGQAVLLRRLADKIVPPEEVESLRQVLLIYLDEQFEAAEKATAALAPRSQELVRLGLDRNTEGLGKVLEKAVRDTPSEPCLSPTRGHPPGCPVFLLHGSIDNVIPPSESLELKAWASRATKTTCLVSELIRHVELEKGEQGPGWRDYWKIIRFWTELLRS